jgi:ubiquinone/menaquinone biosynthesis C-methylase UbiE
MYARSARFYDVLYGFKDYNGMSQTLTGLIRGLRPSASSVLEVACGTGKFLEHLQQVYYVEGLDINSELLAIARDRCPGVQLHLGDMLNFSLEKRFDVVVCLFSSIAYMRRVEELRAAVVNMTRHLDSGGLLLIEPWYSPERFWTGDVTANFMQQPDLKIAWMYTSKLENELSVLEMQYLVGTPDGIEHFTERHELGLFTDMEYREAITDAGLAVDYDATGLFGRGMYIGSCEGRIAGSTGPTRTCSDPSHPLSAL